MIHRRRQPSHNAIAEYRECSCSYLDDSSEISTMTNSSIMSDEDTNLRVLSVDQDSAPPRKKARTERNQMRSIRRRGALEHSQLLKNVMAASMADDLEDDPVFVYDPLRGSKRRRDSENCTDASDQNNISGVDDMFTLMTMKPDAVRISSISFS